MVRSTTCKREYVERQDDRFLASVVAQGYIAHVLCRKREVRRHLSYVNHKVTLRSFIRFNSTLSEPYRGLLRECLDQLLNRQILERLLQSVVLASTNTTADYLPHNFYLNCRNLKFDVKRCPFGVMPIPDNCLWRLYQLNFWIVRWISDDDRYTNESIISLRDFIVGIVCAIRLASSVLRNFPCALISEIALAHKG